MSDHIKDGMLIPYPEQREDEGDWYVVEAIRQRPFVQGNALDERWLVRAACHGDAACRAPGPTTKFAVSGPDADGRYCVEVWDLAPPSGTG